MSVAKGIALLGVVLIGIALVVMRSEPTMAPAPPSPSELMFTTLHALPVTPTSGAALPTAIPEVNGIGLAVLDVDDDGTMELFVANGATLDDPESGPGCALIDTSPPWRDRTAEAGINITRWATSATPFDMDGDGDTDLHVTCIGPNVMLRNDGGTFTDITATSGLGNDGWGTCAAVGDIDGDGWTDLYVVNYLHWSFDDPVPPPMSFMGAQVLAGPRGLQPQHDALYINNRDGTFRDVSQAWGLHDIEAGFGLNAVITDFTGDGQQDILVGNDTTANRLLVRSSDPQQPTIIDRGFASGLSTNADGGEQATMGLAIGDTNGDGRPDVFSTNFSSDTNTLHESTDTGWWADRTQARGLGLHSRPLLGWSTCFQDLDGDADEDLLLVNGHVYPQATIKTMDSDWAQPPQRLHRDGDRFTIVELDDWTAHAGIRRAAVRGPSPNGPVLWVAGRDMALEHVILHGDPKTAPCTVSLLDDRPDIGNREAHGAHVRFDDGTSVQHRWITTSSPFQGGEPPLMWVHFGPHTPTHVECTVHWPDGGATVHHLDAPTPGTTLQLMRSHGTTINTP
ncbi:MAG: CRTAC1 family protein [Phycisphaerales bacterium]|nr:CRTAC1 family protein [Phycisphaerales bacterium]